LVNVSFAEVANQFISGLNNQFAHRSSKGLAHNTRRLYARYASRASQSLGPLPLTDVNAFEVKKYIAELKRENLADTSIVSHFQVLRSVVESVRDDYGNPVANAKFNLSFVGLPIVHADKLRAPIASTGDIEKAISLGGEFGCLIALLAGTGLRISEAISLTVNGTGNRYEPAQSRIIILQGKTDAAARTVPLHTTLNDRLAKLAVGRTGRLFKGSESRFRHLIAKHRLAPFHGYRRFRATHLRRSNMNEEILKYLLGHARTGITDRYSRLSQDMQFVRTEVERAGLGW
jgi:integrase